MPAEFDPGRGGMLGVNDLQQTVDKFNEAVTTLTGTVNNMSSVMSTGLTRSPSHSASADGATFSAQPGMGSTMASFVSASHGSPSGPGSGGGGGGSGGGGQGGLGSGGWGGGGGAGSAGGSGGSGFSSGMGATPAQMVQATSGAIGNWGNSVQGNMTLFNAFGTQMQTQWSWGAQAAQNQTFGYYNASQNAAALNAQDAAAEYSTLAQIGGGNPSASSRGRNALTATNAFAYANQGLGGAGASSLAGWLYNPTTSLRMMQQGVRYTPLNQGTGTANNLASFISNYEHQVGVSGYNAKTGTFNQNSLNAAYAVGGSVYMSLLASGASANQIQDLQSTASMLNQAAIKGHTTTSNVLSVVQQAENGSPDARSKANKQLAAWDIPTSQLQQQQNQNAANTAQQQGESSAYIRAMSDAATVTTEYTKAVSAFLDKTGLGKAIGAAGGSGLGGIVSDVTGFLSGGAVSNVVGAVLGGGAAAVSATQPMTAQSRTAGSSLSSVPGQAVTAVRDAVAQQGKPYVYGGSNPRTSFDCSGLVMWAYGQAGVKLPRTSEQQWSALSNKSVPLNQVREGDIVFSAGSDGSASAPGHEALLISNNQIVEAPYTGANIRIRSYSPGEWQHAARPVGGRTGTSNSNSVSTTAGSRLASGNTGGAISAGGNGDASLALTTDADATLFSGGAGRGGTGLMAITVNGGAASNSSAGASSQTFTGGGSAAQNEALARQMAQQLYGWAGNQWTDGLLPLWTQESGFNTKATNPQSGAYGIGQALPSSKYASAGADWQTNPATQIKWGLGYIHDRYGSPLAAEAHEKGYQWYGTGGPVVVGDRGPELFVPNQSGTIKNARDTASLLRGNSAQVAQAPWTASPAQQLVLDTLTSANNHARSAGGGGITVNLGGVTVNGGVSGSSSPGVAGDVYTIGQQLTVAVTRELEKNDMLSNIAKGVTG